MYTRLAIEKPDAGRPAAASASRTVRTCAANASVVDDPAPKKPSPSRTARRSAVSLAPPNHSGGYGRCSGFGSMAASLSCQNSPSKVTLGWVHSAFISATPSVNRATYREPSTPNPAKGRDGPPVPTPTSIRPPLSWSSDATLFARCTGLCSVETNTTHPSRRRVVQAAAKVIASRGSSCGPGPSVPSWAHALSYTPSSSTREK
ncbi:MAG TPA: hypothetical protein VK817_19570 [Trebonia sp.]|jgi:hypothetical protein|nr:hypothetical protein [Trebonia sp.]